MNFFDKVKNLFNSDEGFIDWIEKTYSNNIKIKEFAMNRCIDLIASTVSKLEIQVYRNKENVIKSVKDNTYYTLNIKPNDNEIGTSFIYNTISKLFNDGEILIIQINNFLYLAEKFEKTEEILKPKTFKNIILRDSENTDLSIKKIFKSNEVVYLSLNELTLKNKLNTYASDFEKLITVAKEHILKNNKFKWKIQFPTNLSLKDPKTGNDVTYEDYKKRLLEGIDNDESSAIILSKEIELERLSGDKYVPSNDYLDLMKKWEENIAKFYKIPLEIYHGNITEKSQNENLFITQAIIPIIRLLEDSLNKVLIPREDYLKGECIKVNKSNVKHFDIFDTATAQDKLFAIGYTHNNLREFSDLVPSSEKWADEHNITKNYSSEGGDKNA